MALVTRDFANIKNRFFALFSVSLSTMLCARTLVLATLVALCAPSARATDVTPDQIQASFATTWTKAQYMQAAQNYYLAKHSNWTSWVASLLSAGGNRFVLAEVKPCAALYRETGDTKYSDAVRAILVGTINNNTMEYIAEQDFNYCYLQVRNSASVSAADRTLIENFISQRMAYIMTQDSDTTFCRGMMNCAALAYAVQLLPNDPNVSTWQTWAQTNWNNGMVRIKDVSEDASNYEPMWFAGCYEYLKMTGADITAFFNQPGIRNLCERNLQAASCLGLIPSYGRGGSYSQQSQMPGPYETMATIYRDGRFKAVAQRMFNYMRTVVDANWIGMLDVSAIPVFDQADDTVPVTPLTRPTVATYDRLLISRTFPDKLVMESGNQAGDSSVLMNFTQGGNHGHDGGSALVSFIDQASPLLINRDGDDDRVYHNLMMVRGTSEAFPFVPASAGQPGQQYHFDNVRRRFTLNIKGPQATNGGVPDPAALSKLTIYLAGNTTDTSGNSTVHLYIDNIVAVGASGTLTLSSGTKTYLNTGNWTDVNFSKVRDLTAYDTVEFGMRIEMVTPGAITDVMVLLQTSSAGGYHFHQALDVCSLGKTNDAHAFSKMQYASTQMNLKDTLGGDNIQQRDMMLVPGGVLLVRDRVTFPAAENNVQMGPVWNAANGLSAGTNWVDVRQAKVYSLPQRQLLEYFPTRTDGDNSFTMGTAQDTKSGSTSLITYQKWSGNAAANSTRTFNSLLMGHASSTSASTLAATVQTLQCDETATVLKIGANFLILNPTGASLNVGGLQTDAQSLYLETNGSAVTYYAGTQGSSLVFSGSTVFTQGTRLAGFGSATPIVKVPTNMTVYVAGSAGSVVNYSVEAADNIDGSLAPVCTPASGSVFPMGTTTVNCSATNSNGQTGTGSFTVTVLTAPPVNNWNTTSGNWDTTSPNWSAGGMIWVDGTGDSAVFDNGSGYTVTISAGATRTANHVTFGDLGNNYSWTLTGGTLVAAGNLTMQGYGPNNGTYSLNPTLTVNANVAVAGDTLVGRSNVTISGGNYTTRYITSNAAGSTDWANVTLSGGTVTASGGIDGTYGTNGSNGTALTFQLNLNGGTLVTPYIKVADREPGANGGNNNNAWLTFNGTTVTASRNQAAFITLYGGAQNAYISNSGAIFNTNGYNIGIGPNLKNTTGQTGILTKQGAGTLTLTGTNAFTGVTTISGGTLTIGGTGQLGGGSYTGNITDNAALIYNSSAAQTFGGVISGTGTLTQSGSGTLTLTGANTYTGNTSVTAGTLFVSGTLSASTPLFVSSGAMFQTSHGNVFGNSGYAPTGSWLIAGTFNVSTATTVTMPASVSFNGGTMSGAADAATYGVFLDNSGTTIRANGSGNTISQRIGLFSGITFDTPNVGDSLNVSGILGATLASPNGSAGGVTKIGSGTLTLSGTNIFTGNTLVNSGTLALSGTGSIAGSPLVTVAAGATLDASAVTSGNWTLGASQTLAGAGTVRGAFTVGVSGTIYPGGTGTLSTTGAATISGTYTCDINATASGKLAVGGALTLSGAALHMNALATPTASSYTIATYGSRSGTFAGLTEGASVTIGSATYIIKYADGGNNITLTPAVLPGFGSWIAGFSGLGDSTTGGNPSRDGISNLMKYVLHGDPRVSDMGILPTMRNSGGNLVFTFHRLHQSAGDTTQIFQSSANLVTWADETVPPSGTSGDVVVTADTPTAGIDEVVVKVAKGANTKLFARLKVTRP